MFYRIIVLCYAGYFSYKLIIRFNVARARSGRKFQYLPFLSKMNFLKKAVDKIFVCYDYCRLHIAKK